ncbi:hypothetical protein [Ramlibacter sp.]|uniref:hypothetical protein n=1 Tax=Ramlibacter sp. TaxID=1917967 RepID=UPI002C9B52C1|nr:hypothetical protein [Ramlibacter sp.]HWI81972.1 hypothetical protein [Ramlibacter sp.]
MSAVSGLGALASAAGGSSQADAAGVHPAGVDGPRHRMCVAGEKLRQAARCRAQPLGMLVVQIHDLRELELLFGSGAGAEAARLALAELTRLGGRTGLALRTAADTFTLLMPDACAEDLVEAIEARLGKVYAIEFELGAHEIILVPDVLARRVRSTESVAEAYATLCSDIVQARSCEQRRQEFLRRERESHSMPASLTAAVAPRLQPA